MSAFVYLLWHKTEPRFKIGKADNLSARINQLGSNQFDLSRTKALELDNCAGAINLERILHRAFRAHRLIPGEAAPASCPALRKGRRDGDTEWFDAECWGRLHVFLEQNEDLFLYTWASAETVAYQVEQVASMVGRRNGTRKLPKQKPYFDEWAYLRAEQVKAKNLLEGEAHEAVKALADLRSASTFLAVIRTDEGYQLVGECAVNGSLVVATAVEMMRPLVPKKCRIAFAKNRRAFTVPLCGAPGRPLEEATTLQNWAERLAWAQQPGVPGFDLTLQVQEMQHAARLLKNEFGALAQRTVQAPVNMASAD